MESTTINDEDDRDYARRAEVQNDQRYRVKWLDSNKTQDRKSDRMGNSVQQVASSGLALVQVPRWSDGSRMGEICRHNESH